MNTVIINSLTLCNFGCFRDITFQFKDDITTIVGRNGSGKSTIANAISWLLTGKSADGKTQFSIKTHDEQGNDIPKADHFVQAVLTINGEQHTIKRGINEKWSKVKGEDKEVMSNETYFFINDQPANKVDWDAFIDSHIAKLPIYMAVSNPRYFPSLDWKTQRAFLYKMVGGVSQEEIANGDSKYDPLLDVLKEQDISNYLTSLGYQYRELKKKLDMVPARIKEVEKLRPQKQDWSTVHKSLEEQKAKMQQLQSQLSACQSGGAQSAARQQLQKNLEFAEKRITFIYRGVKDKYDADLKEIDNNISLANGRVNNAQNTIDDLKARIEGLNQLIKRAEQAKNAAKIEKQTIEQQFDELSHNVFSFPQDQQFCPTCGQMLPQDRIEERVNELREAHNKAKVAKSNDLKLRYKQAKKDIEDAENTINSYNATIAKDTTSMQVATNDLNAAKKELEDYQKQKQELKTVDVQLSLNENYQQILKEKEQIIAKMDAPDVDADTTAKMTESIKSDIMQLQSSIDTLNSVLAEETMYNKVCKQIDDIENERLGISSKMTELEGRMNLAQEYSDRSATILEGKVNSRFHYCHFKMFKNLINGSREDFCEIYDPSGSAYHNGMNTASQLKCGLDIINTLSEVYGVHAPIVIDQAETSLSIPDTPMSQQIRLEVKDCDLTVA
jgi:exonuclease SbcC